MTRISSFVEATPTSGRECAIQRLLPIASLGFHFIQMTPRSRDTTVIARGFLSAKLKGAIVQTGLSPTVGCRRRGGYRRTWDWPRLLPSWRVFRRQNRNFLTAVHPCPRFISPSLFF